MSRSTINLQFFLEYKSNMITEKKERSIRRQIFTVRYCTRREPEDRGSMIQSLAIDRDLGRIDGESELFDQVPREIPAFPANFRQSARVSSTLFSFFLRRILYNRGR